MLQSLVFHRAEISKFDPDAWLSPATLVTGPWNDFGAMYLRQGSGYAHPTL
jgi:hypothetical protein